MGHNINRNIITGKDAFFSVKEKAWHELGQIVEEHPTSEEAIIYAGLNYEVEKLPNIHRLPNGKEIESKNSFFTYRKDTMQILGDKLGSDYKVIQNKTAFSFFDSLVTDNTGIKYETAGALGNGERIFITAKLPDVMKIGRRGKDEIEQYIFLTTAHNGDGAAMAAYTPIRIVCNNTLNMALKNNSNAVYIKHTENAEERLKEAAHIIQISDKLTEKLSDMFNQWARVRINDAELKKLIRLAMSPNREVFNAIVTNNTAFEFSKQFEEVTGNVFEYAMTSPAQTMETTAGTLFGAYNAITGYYQNIKEYKTADQKINSLFYGTANERTKKAFELCEQAQTFLS